MNKKEYNVYGEEIVRNADGSIENCKGCFKPAPWCMYCVIATPVKNKKKEVK